MAGDPTEYQQAQGYYPDGTPIPADKLGEALARGEAGFQEGSRVIMTDADGNQVAADLSDVQGLHKSGYVPVSEASLAAQREELARQANEEKLRGAPGTLHRAVSDFAGFQQSAVNANLRGATFGLSDKAIASTIDATAAGLGALGIKDEGKYGPRSGAEYLKQQRDRHQTWSAVNEVAGGVAGALLPTGGAGAVGRGLSVLSAPARAAAALGRGAQGAVGLGRATSVTGRVLGAAVQAGVAGATEGALQGMGQEFSRAVLEEKELTAQKLVSGAGWGALIGGGLGGAFGAAGQGVSETATAVIQRLGGDDAIRAALEKTAGDRAVKQLGGNYMRVEKLAERFNVNKARAGNKALEAGIPLGNTAETTAALTAKVDDAAERMNQVAAQMDAAGVKVDKQPIAQALLAKADDLAAIEGDRAMARAADALRKDASFLLESGSESAFSMFRKMRRGVGEATDRGSQLSRSLGDYKYAAYSDAMEEALTRASTVGDEASDLASAYRKASEDFKDFKYLSDINEELAKSRATNRTFSLSDYVSGAGVGGNAVTAALVTGSPLPLLAAAGQPVIAAGNKFLREQGSGYVARMAKALSKADGSLEAGVRGIVDGLPSRIGKRTGAKGGAAVVAQAGEGKAPKTVESMREVQRLAGDPDKAIDSLAGKLSAVHEGTPELATEMVATASRGLHFLASKVPEPLGGADGALQPQHASASYTSEDVRKFERYLTAVNSPMTVVQDLARGRINREGIEAIKAVYPDLFADLRTRIKMQLADAKKPVSYQRRVLLSLAFDFDGDRSLRPQNMQAIQQTYAAQAKQTQEPPKPRPGAFDAGGDMQLTPSQKAITS